MEQSDKQGLELTDKTVNRINEIFNSPDDWLGFEDVRLVEGYIKGDLRLVFRASVAGIEWLAYFQRFPEIRRGKLRNFGSVVITPESAGEVYANLTNSAECGKQSMMLVGNVQFMEYPEIVSLPVFVRFGAPDFILRSIRHSLYLSSKRGFVNFGALENGKASPVRNRIPLNEHKVTGEVIQSTSEVMESVARNGADFVGDGLNPAHKEEIKILVSRLSMWLGSDGVRFALDEPVPQDFQIHEVLLGPFDFYANQSESFVSGEH